MKTDKRKSLKRKYNRKVSKIPENVDIKVLIKLIHLLDAYRVNRLLDFRPLDKDIRQGKLGKRLVQEWEAIKKNLRKMSDLAGGSPEIDRLVRLKSIVRLVATIYAAVVFVVIVSGTALVDQQMFMYFFIASIILIPIPMYLEVFFLRRIAKKVDEAFENHPERFKMFRRHLKFVVQDLICQLADIIKRRGEDPEKYEVRLYTINYKGIAIKKTPGRLDRCYKVILKC